MLIDQCGPSATTCRPRARQLWAGSRRDVVARAAGIAEDAALNLAPVVLERVIQVHGRGVRRGVRITVTDGPVDRGVFLNLVRTWAKDIREQRPEVEEAGGQDLQQHANRPEVIADDYRRVKQDDGKVVNWSFETLALRF